MPVRAKNLPKIVAELEELHGVPPPPDVTGPFEMILRENIAYLANDAKRAAAWEALRRRVGTTPGAILAAPRTERAAIARAGILASDRVEKIRECARIAVEEFGGDLDRALDRAPAKAAKGCCSATASPSARRPIRAARPAPSASIARTGREEPGHNAAMKTTATLAWGAPALFAAAMACSQAAAPDPVLIGAGDIADCAAPGPAAGTARLIEHVAGTVFTLGDNAYESGTPRQYDECYGPTWGRFKARTRPVVGNHEYLTACAAGYFGYFGAAGGDPTRGYYSYDLGRWHIVVINSNCGEIDGCQTGSPQEQWLRQDLASHPAPCTVAMWHNPRYSSGEHGDDPSMRDIWKALYDANADVVLSGHDHDYQRFAPQDADGNADPVRGIRQFVAGTGGRNLYPWEHKDSNSEAKNNETFGVLKMTLHDGGYDWEFVPVEGQTFTDRGSAKCH